MEERFPSHLIFMMFAQYEFSTVITAASTAPANYSKYCAYQGVTVTSMASKSKYRANTEGETRAHAMLIQR